MRTYFIYLIEDEVADYFYGREIKFYELFAAKCKVQGELQEIIKKQIQFITKPLPYLELHHHLSSSVQKREMKIKGKTYYIGAPKADKRAELLIGKRCLELHALGDFESESVFFEVLRKFDGRFLAVDIENNRYGWIKAVKERKFV
ncbi:sporulation inhibitor of replication protein SirA [Lederbergia lenta]|uniref:YneE n=1 Tax=Lederbergia lenta TaxID=1467 RepID=A0A2X4Z5U9_LEDLE|nr:sporulation inhibitor of replication protein SirA [Lederbergia lenta]MCM3109735.1 sporulation inhibitor of replication protein SirA [Lederbergia lenta]MEC2324514.1 sporulation inhibitor of replication protein SirA [Lederbergia lenta]SQI59625.1 YneE [Lederbergia lenta]